MEFDLDFLMMYDIKEKHAVVLREVDGARMIAIMVVAYEVSALARAIKNPPSPRPLTHDVTTKTVSTIVGFPTRFRAESV